MTDSRQAPFFPMMVDLKGRKILIAGGGAVASRRAGTLLTCGAEITAVSPSFIPGFPEGILRVARKFSPDDIAPGLSLIVAATNDRAVNHMIHVMAKSAGIAVNVADCQEECDFFFPSLINSGPVAVSVCSAGIMPSLTRRLSDRLRRVWPIWITQENDR
ncbi:MAG: bifunctional precorrin-2 dehydrogenase/sirohydrochlorin ferrochelatase [Synergistaceae bacterium]|nr:bifunctional precorrin-2 dehydrogenase/sirohydrochlorin ferrochelatase [Synergistaceae bacterium]MBQ6972585.1 bifunctional precorrin-2 dehydrogenase/sirohydrochlorin ferrochelatase [Synergistaceae bacterium]